MKSGKRISVQLPPLVVIFNRRALAARALGRSGLAGALRERDVAHEIVDTDTPEQARAVAREAAAAGKAVLAAGGDGTARDVADGMLAAGMPDSVMGIVPLGTGNDLACALGRVGRGIEPALDAVAEFHVRPIDVGQVNEGEYFLNVLGVGFDAEVARRRSGQRFRAPSYFPGIVRSYLSYRPRAYRVTWPDRTLEGRAMMVTAMNGTNEGGGFRLAPGARLEDGLLDVYWIDPVSPVQFARYIWAVRWGTHDQLPMVHKERTAAMTVESEAPLQYHLDGEYRELGPGEPLQVKVHRQRLRMIV